MLNAYVHQFDGAISLGTLPLAAGLIVASAKSDPAVRAGFQFQIATDRVDADHIVASYDRPEVVAMSCYPWNLRYSLHVAKRAKARHPDCMIVLGGQAIPRRPEAVRDFLAHNPAVDVVVLGEGELTFRELLCSRLRGSALTAIEGLAFRSNQTEGGVIINHPRARMAQQELEREPSPFLDGTLDDYMERRSGLYRALVETNRGCPFSCTFCVWGHKDQCRIHEFPQARVEGELEWVGLHRVPHLYLVDANFGIMKRDLETTQQVVRTRVKHGFPRSCYLNLTKNVTESSLEIFQILRRGDVGCLVELSMQDSNPQVLATVKRFNISQDRSLQLRTRCLELGLACYNELILGLPTQTYDSFCDTVVGALSPLPADAFHIYLCRVVENSEMAQPEHRAAHGIITRSCVMVPADPAAMDERVADYEEIVVGTSTMPPEEWRLAHDLGYLATAFVSMRLMDVVIQYLRFALGANMKAFFRAIQRRAVEVDTDGSPSALRTLGRVLDRYTQSILSGGPLLLAVNGAGTRRWQIREALLIDGVRHHERLVDEVSAITHTLLESGELGASADPVLIDELFRYQKFATPTFDRKRPTEERFTTDWWSYQQNGGLEPPMRNGDLALRYQPPPYVQSAPDFEWYVARRIAAIYAERGATCISRVEDLLHQVP